GSDPLCAAGPARGSRSTGVLPICSSSPHLARLEFCKMPGAWSSNAMPGTIRFRLGWNHLFGWQLIPRLEATRNGRLRQEPFWARLWRTFLLEAGLPSRVWNIGSGLNYRAGSQRRSKLWVFSDP